MNEPTLASVPWTDLLDMVQDLSGSREAPEQPQEILDELLRVRGLLDSLKYRESFLEGELSKQMNEKSERIGKFQVEKKRAAKRTEWDHDGIFQKLTAVSLEDRQVSENGEIESPLEAFTRHLRNTASVGYWRVNALKDAGIDPWDYRKVEWGREKIVVTELYQADSDEV